jgi:signal transduction histidine kinase
MTKASKVPKPAEMIALKVQHEQQWAYSLRLEHMSYPQMRQVANLPADRGGLGHDISEHGLKTLVAGYAETMREVLAVDRTELIERQQHELDELARAARRALAKADAVGVLDKDAAKVLLDVQKREETLYGLAAPTEANVTVTSRDGVLDDLNAALARMGEKAVKA